MAAWRAKLNDGDMSCSCFGMIIYTCLKCKIPVCNKSSILEDEDYHGWVAGKTVAFKTVCILLLFSLEKERLLLADYCRNPWRPPCLQL